MATKSQIEIIRAANTTAYAAGQVINSSGSISALMLNIASGLCVLGGQCISSNPAGTPSITFHLFSIVPTVAADGVAFDPTYLQAKNGYLGSVTFSAWTPFASIKVSSAGAVAPFTISYSGATYCVIVANGAYTPTSGENITAQFDFG